MSKLENHDVRMNVNQLKPTIDSMTDLCDNQFEVTDTVPLARALGTLIEYQEAFQGRWSTLGKMYTNDDAINKDHPKYDDWAAKAEVLLKEQVVVTLPKITLKFLESRPEVKISALTLSTLMTVGVVVDTEIEAVKEEIEE